MTQLTDKELKHAILKGKIFIYPTDTVYGLGCNAENKASVEKIKEIKARDKDKPLSVIAPSNKWIKDNLIVEDLILEKYLPGPYTLILKKKDGNFLKWVSLDHTLGVRIPNNKFCDKIREIGKPFITTSVNLSGEKPIININNIPETIKNQVDIIIEIEGNLSGKPSTLIINGEQISRD